MEKDKRHFCFQCGSEQFIINIQEPKKILLICFHCEHPAPYAVELKWSNDVVEG